MDILITFKHADAGEKQLIENILAEYNIGVRISLSYKNAIEELAKHKYSIVILYCFNGNDDLKTTEAVRIMKEIVPNLLIIAVSEETPLETERELRKSGLYFHLASPLVEEELRDVLSGAIKKEMNRRKR